MKRSDLTEKLLDIKREKGWTWKHIVSEIGGMSEVLIVGALLGQMKLTKPQCEKAAALFDLTENEKRLYELVMINGPAWKALIEEEFGDGIMSAIDFDLEMERLSDPKGDRVKLTMSGKFLPFKYYGATGNNQALGYKEE
jgi:cyanate lyase